ncbi:hypothetical protein B0H14DRAFT_2577268 [Mycena olivaceomarginata]|nr:hypothetical protein B0H14DRAFT_2577268 [Mycena olivaceomarginata]
MCTSEYTSYREYGYLGLETMQDQIFISHNFGPGLRAQLGPEKSKAQALGPLKPCVGPGPTRACEGSAWQASGPQAGPRTSLVDIMEGTGTGHGYSTFDEADGGGGGGEKEVAVR